MTTNTDQNGKSKACRLLSSGWMAPLEQTRVCVSRGG